MGNITLNFDGMKNALNEIDNLLLYLKQSKNEIKGILNKEEYATEIAVLLRNINDISIKAKQYGNWIDETIDKFKNTELLNEDVVLEKSQTAIKFGIESKTGATSRSASSFVSVGRAVPVDGGGGSKPSSKSSSSSKSGLSSLLDTAAKVVKSVVNAVTNLFNSSSNTTSSPTSNTTSSSTKSSNRNNNSSNYEEQNSGNTPTPERNLQEEVEEKNKGFLASLMNKMKAFGSFVANITSSVASNKKVTNVVEGLTQDEIDYREGKHEQMAAKQARERQELIRKAENKLLGESTYYSNTDFLRKLTNNQLEEIVSGRKHVSEVLTEYTQEHNGYQFPTFSEIGKSAAASVVNGYSAFAKGIAGTLENLADTVALINDGVAESIAGIIGKVAGFFGATKLEKEINLATNESSKGVKRFVAKNWIEDIYNSYYNTNAAGKWLEENAIGALKSEGIGSNILSGLGKVATIVTMGGLTGSTAGLATGAKTTTGFLNALFAGLAGSGEGSQKYWKNITDTANPKEDLNDPFLEVFGGAYSFFNGSWESLQWLTGANLSGKGIKAVLADTLFNGLDTPFRAATDTMMGGDFTQSFNELGGWNSVISNVAVGAIGSTIGEIMDFFRKPTVNLPEKPTINLSESQKRYLNYLEEHPEFKNPDLSGTREKLIDYFTRHPELGKSTVDIDDVLKEVYQIPNENGEWNNLLKLAEMHPCTKGFHSSATREDFSFG